MIPFNQIQMKILSLGLGRQSTALYYLSSLNVIERFDYAIFADTGAEKKSTYDYLEYLKKWQKKNNGIEIIVANYKNLYRDLKNVKLKDFRAIPAFTQNSRNEKGMLKRQCTTHYKIRQVNKKIKELYGLSGKQHYPLTSVYIGITIDEIQRAKYPQEGWKIQIYPFLNFASYKNVFESCKYNLFYTAQDCINYIKSLRVPIPSKSSCTFCPYNTNSDFAQMKKYHVSDFAQALDIDETIRDSSHKKIKDNLYIHESCKPLFKVDLKSENNNLFNCSDGYCAI
jgi:hypothetical protein